MSKDLETPFASGRDGTIICAHCGLGKGEGWHEVNCECPEHLDSLVIGKEEIVDLAERVDQFETFLENEPCQKDGACVIMSVSRSMCPACRLKLMFFHTIYSRS